MILEALSEGRIHLTGVRLLAPHLVEENVTELPAAAESKTKAEIEQLLADRFPRTEVMTMIYASPDPRLQACVPAMNHEPGTEALGVQSPEQALEPVPLPSASKVAPLSAQSFELHVTIDRETHELLRYAQELSSHQIPSCDIAQVLHRALAEHVRRLEKRKFGTTSEPRGGARPCHRGGARPRTRGAGTRSRRRKRNGSATRTRSRRRM